VFNSSISVILPSTVVITMDNSGARRVKCIRVYKKPGISYAIIGDTLLVIIVRLRNRGLIRVKRGEFHTCVVVRISSRIFRKKNGYFFKFDSNTVLMLTKKGLPIGTRIFGPCSKELIHKGFNRIVSLCSSIL
jgi:large subunit ribosomal protein L14